MDDFDKRYVQMLQERDYPTPPPEPVEAKPAAAKPAATAKHPSMTPGDIGLTIMDTFEGLARGAVQASLGVGGDIREIVDMASKETAEKILGSRVLPTTEEVKQFLQGVLPQFQEGVQIDPRRRETGRSSQDLGEYLPLAPIKAAKDVGKAVVSAAKAVAKNKGVTK